MEDEGYPESGAPTKSDNKEGGKNVEECLDAERDMDLCMDAYLKYCSFMDSAGVIQETSM